MYMMYVAGWMDNGHEMMDAFRWSISSSFDLRQICCE